MVFNKHEFEQKALAYYLLLKTFCRENQGRSCGKINRVTYREGHVIWMLFQNLNFGGCFWIHFGPGGLRAPCVLACAMRSLAIVFTIVQSFFLSLSLSLFLFPPSSAFDPLRGISRVRKFVSPNILAYLEDICKKKYVFWVIFFPPKKKGDFRAIFLLFTASVRSRPPGPPAVPGVLD